MKRIFTLLVLASGFLSSTAQMYYVEHQQLGAAGNDQGNKIHRTALGAMLLSGSFENTVSGYVSVGGSDAMIQRKANNGLADWTLRHGSALTDQARCITTSQNRVIEAGYFQNTIDFDHSYWQIYNQVSNNGVGVYINCVDTFSIPIYLWSRSIVPSNASSGITVKDMCTDLLGNTYIIGTFYGSVFVETSYSVGQTKTASTYGDIYFAKFNSAGVFQWFKQIQLTTNPGIKTGTSSARSHSGNAIAADANGDIYIAGRMANGIIDLDPGAGVVNVSGTTSFFMAKYSGAGNYIRSFKPNGASTDFDEAIDLQLSGSSVLITGVYGGTGGWLSDFDPSPATFYLPEPGFEGNAFVAKYDTTFSFQWAKHIDNLQTTTNYLGREVYGNAITTDANDNVYIGVNFKRNIELNPGGVSQVMNIAGVYDAAIVKYDAAGNFLWANQFGTAGDEGINDLITDEQSNLYMSGYFSNTLNLNPLGTAVNVVSAGLKDWIFAKFSQNTPLPVTWNSFTAHLKSNQQVELKWTTSSEVNCSHYIVEKSGDAKEWKVCAKVNSLGDRMSETTYTSTDENPLLGFTYYRIRQVDHDGRSSLSAVEKIQITDLSTQIFYYPNPANMHLNIRLNQMEETSVEIFSLEGKLLLRNIISGSSKIDIASLLSGTYILKMYNKAIMQTGTFIKN